MAESRQKLIKELDSLCSEYVRKRDNKCILCGSFVGEWKRLQSHHWIVSRARSLKYRFDPRNCVSLCYACHIHKVHQHPDIATIDALTQRALIAGILNKEELEDIKADSNCVYKMTISEIKDKIEWFKRMNGEEKD